MFALSTDLTTKSNKVNLFNIHFLLIVIMIYFCFRYLVLNLKKERNVLLKEFICKFMIEL